MAALVDFVDVNWLQIILNIAAWLLQQPFWGCEFATVCEDGDQIAVPAGASCQLSRRLTPTCEL